MSRLIGLLLFCSTVQPLFGWNWCDCENAFLVENIDGFINLSNNERFRGVSYTENDPCVSGLIRWTHDCTGFYIAVYTESNESLGTDIFVEPLVGLLKTWGNVEFNLELRYGIFPGNSSPRDLEVYDTYLTLGYNFKLLTTRVGLSYIPEYYFTRHPQWYPFIQVSIPLPCRFLFTGEYGYQELNRWEILGLEPHHVWDFSLTRDFKGFYLGAR